MDIQNLGQCTYVGCQKRTNVVTDDEGEYRCKSHRATCHMCDSVIIRESRLTVHTAFGAGYACCPECAETIRKSRDTYYRLA